MPRPFDKLRGLTGKVGMADTRGRGPMSSLGGEAATVVGAGVLRALIEQVAFAAADDDTKPILTGVLAACASGSLALVATDGFRLATMSAGLRQPGQGDWSVIVPARRLSELRETLPEGDESVEMTVIPHPPSLVFRAADRQMESPLLEGEYPNYRVLFPSTIVTRAVVSTTELLQATRDVCVSSLDRPTVMTLDIRPGAEASRGRITVSGAAAGPGEERAELATVVSGNPVRLHFNARYVAEVLDVLPSQRVGLEISGPTSVTVFRPIDGADCLHLVLPIRLSDQ